MGADGGHIGAVPAEPAAGRDGGVDKVQGVARSIGALQRQLGGDHTLRSRRLLNTAIGGGGELVALEDHIVHGVGELGAGHAVEYHVAHSDLTLQGLIAAFSVDDPGEPVQIFLIVKAVAGRDGAAARGDGDSAILSVPDYLSAQGRAQGADRNHHTAVFQLYAGGHIQAAAVGHNILGAGLEFQLQAGGGHFRLAIGPHGGGVGIEGLHNGPIGNVRRIVLYLAGKFLDKGRTVYFKADAALSSVRRAGQRHTKGQTRERAKGSFLHY